MKPLLVLLNVGIAILIMLASFCFISNNDWQRPLFASWKAGVTALLQKGIKFMWRDTGALITIPLLTKDNMVVALLLIAF